MICPSGHPPPAPTPLRLRGQAIRQLVHVILDGPSGYRTAREVEALFRQLGQAHGRQLRESRIGYATRVFEEAQQREDLLPLLVRLLQAEASAPVREHLREKLVGLLSPYGWTVNLDPATGRFAVSPATPWTLPVTPGVLALPTFDGALFSPAEVLLLENRWREAAVMQQAGALRMTVVALGSLLEYVLRVYAQARPAQAQASGRAPHHHGPIRDWKLTTLLEVAAERGWTSLPGEEFPYRLREYRSYLLPGKELQEGPFLDEALSAEIWHKVRRTLEDLDSLSRR